MEIPLSCGGVHCSHAGDLSGRTTRDGVSADGRRTVALEATGDGAPDLSTEVARNALIDTELCAAGRKQQARVQPAVSTKSGRRMPCRLR
nr:hypothetical protein OG999_25545 [Streptomyces sp. NBC_00886]